MSTPTPLGGNGRAPSPTGFQVFYRDLQGAAGVLDTVRGDQPAGVLLGRIAAKMGVDGARMPAVLPNLANFEVDTHIVRAEQMFHMPPAPPSPPPAPAFPVDACPWRAGEESARRVLGGER